MLYGGPVCPFLTHCAGVTTTAVVTAADTVHFSALLTEKYRVPKTVILEAEIKL